MSNHVPGDFKFCGTARALDGYFGLPLKELVRFVSPNAEGREDSFQRAPAVPAESTCFEELGVLPFLNVRNVPRLDSLEPLPVVIRLGGKKDKGVVGKPESASRTLFRALIEFLHPLQWIRGVHFQRTSTWFPVRNGCLCIEKVAVGFPDVLSEAAASYLFVE